ncbi:MAG: TIGR00153 family protein [Pseudomonadales bacterium]
MASDYISRLFGASPVRPIQEHFAQATACAMVLEPFFDAAIAGDWQRAVEARERIIELEHAADDAKRKLRLALPNSLLMPVNRSDLLELLSMQDAIANQAKDISGLVTGRRMRIPDSLGKPYQEFLRCCLRAVVQAERSVGELDELFETGFRGKEVDVVMAMTEELDRIENESDELQVDLRSRLFQIERQLPPVDVMFLYQIIDWTGELGDLAHRVGSRLHLLISK